MNQNYDERALVEQLHALPRTNKTAFAAACAERLLPLFERYVVATGVGSVSTLREVVANSWLAAAGAEVDLSAAQAIAESMVPSEDDGAWIFEMGYGQSAAAAAAYAARTWLLDSPQDAGWAARQVYEVADYAAQRALKAHGGDAVHSEGAILESDVVQAALSAIGRDLAEVTMATTDWECMRLRARGEGQTWAATMP